MAKKKFTAVRWAWLGDPNKWIDYDEATNLKIENEYLSGNKKVKVDKERFIDLSLTNAEAIKHFNKLDDPDEVIGLQRRYDDEMKRRAVRRVVPDFFDSDNILLLGNLQKNDDLSADIELYGGVVAKKFTNKITIVLCEEAELDSFEDIAQQATDSKIPIVTPDWIEDCIKNRKKRPTKNFALSFKPKAKEVAKKRKASQEEEEEEDNNNKKKKEKVGKQEAKEEKKPAKEEKKQEEEKKEDKKAPKNDVKVGDGEENYLLEDFADCPTLKTGSSWMGPCIMDSDGSAYPQVLTLTERNGANIAGEISWPTLNNAKTKFKGTVQGKTLTYEEYEAIQGENDVMLPMKYEATMSDDGNKFVGKTEPDDPLDASSFTLDRVPVGPSRDLDVLKANTKWKGVAYTPFEFEFEVTKRNKNSVEGIMRWPSLNGAETKVRGSIEGTEFTFEEYDTQSKDVSVPAYYRGKFSGATKKIGGSFKTDDSNGVFRLNLDK